jgi:hypothetical protein
VLYPPVPRELVKVTILADDNETHRYDVDPVAAARHFGAIRAVECRIAGIFGPVPGLANDVTLWTLKPTRETNAD